MLSLHQSDLILQLRNNLQRKIYQLPPGRKSLGGTSSHISEATTQKGKKMQKTNLCAKENDDSTLVQ